MNQKEIPTVPTERLYCSFCTAERSKNKLEIFEDHRGLILYFKCKDVKACAAHMASVDWSKI